MKIEVAIGMKMRNGKYPVIVKTSNNNPVINTDNLEASSLFGKKDIDVFSDSWDLTPDEIDSLIKTILEDAKYISDSGEEVIIEVGGPGAIELNKRMKKHPGESKYWGVVKPQEDVPLIVFNHNGIKIHVTEMKPIETNGEKPSENEVFELIMAFFESTKNKIEIEKKKKAIKRYRMLLPTNINEGKLSSFTSMTTPDRIKALFPRIEAIPENPLEKFITKYNTLYSSIGRRKFLVIDPRAKIDTAIKSLIMENYDINAIGVNLWTYGSKIQMTPRSFITVKGLIISSNIDSHMYLMSMYNRYGGSTSKITDDFYDMMKKYGFERKTVEQHIAKFRMQPVSKISSIDAEPLENILNQILSSEEWAQTEADFDYLPEEFRTPFAIYMIEKRETLPILSQPSIRGNIHGLEKIVKETTGL